MERVLEYLHGPQWRPADLDDWRACEITSIDDFVPLFLEPFFFGCEADDRINAVAFDTRLNPFGAKLQAIFGSDIGHWDVRDMTTAVREAYELVEQDVVDPADFKDMMFTNSVKFFAGVQSGLLRRHPLRGRRGRAPSTRGLTERTVSIRRPAGGDLGLGGPARRRSDGRRVRPRRPRKGAEGR